MPRPFLRILIAAGLYITICCLLAPDQILTTSQAWVCPPAAAAQVAPAAAPTPQAFTWKDYQDPDTTPQPRTPIWQSALVVLLKLLFVIGLIYVALYGYRRLLGVRAAGALGGRIRVLESTRLAGTQSLVLVEANDRYLLLGSNGAGVLVKLLEWPVDQTAPAPEEAAFARSIAQARSQQTAHGGMPAEAARTDAESRSDDFEGLIDATLRQVVRRPPESSA